MINLHNFHLLIIHGSLFQKSDSPAIEPQIDFIVADAGDDGVDSGLLIDDMNVPRIPVGDYFVPTNKLVVLTPYLILACVLGAATLVFMKRKHK